MVFSSRFLKKENLASGDVAMGEHIKAYTNATVFIHILLKSETYKFENLLGFL
jgi:hypothetical protein